MKVCYCCYELSHFARSGLRFRLAADPPRLVSTSHMCSHVEADLLIKGNILYVDQHAILTTNGNIPPQTIVGDIQGAGHKMVEKEDSHGLKGLHKHHQLALSYLTAGTTVYGHSIETPV